MDAAERSQEYDSSFEELLQEIVFHEIILKNPTAHSAEEREVIQNVLDELRAKLETIQPLPDWGEVEHRR